MFVVYSVYDVNVRGFTPGLVFLLANTSLQDEAVWIYVQETTGKYYQVTLTDENLLEQELKRILYSGNPEAPQPKWIKLEEWMRANCLVGFQKIQREKREIRLKDLFLATWFVYLTVFLPITNVLQNVIAGLVALNSLTIGVLSKERKFKALCFIATIVALLGIFLPV